MYFIYIDDSFEKPFQTYAAIAVPAAKWHEVFSAAVHWRQSLKATDGILITKEFHATEFVAGRGQLGDRVVSKYRRSQVFREAFQFLNSQPGLRVFGVCHDQRPEWAFERLLTRIQRTMQAWDSHALLICDEGDEANFTRLIRKMRKYNPVPIRLADGQRTTANLATKRILEDPIFKESSRSYFIQLADFVAYGLLRREKPLESKNKYGIHTCYDVLVDVVVREASRSDPMGIIR